MCHVPGHPARRRVLEAKDGLAFHAQHVPPVRHARAHTPRRFTPSNEPRCLTHAHTHTPVHAPRTFIWGRGCGPRLYTGYHGPKAGPGIYGTGFGPLGPGFGPPPPPPPERSRGPSPAAGRAQVVSPSLQEQTARPSVAKEAALPAGGRACTRPLSPGSYHPCHLSSPHVGGCHLSRSPCKRPRGRNRKPLISARGHGRGRQQAVSQRAGRRLHIGHCWSPAVRPRANRLISLTFGFCVRKEG